MYTTINFQTKKELKEAVKNGEPVSIFQPNDMFNNPKGAPSYCGTAHVEGPHYPKSHKWWLKLL